MEHLAWTTSSKSSGGNCVEVAHTEDGNHLVRDSKNPGIELVFNQGEWDAFLAGAKDGEFDF